MAFLGFGKKHTRERYKEARKDALLAEIAYVDAKIGGGGESIKGDVRRYLQHHFGYFSQQADQALYKLSKLREQGHKEALALNKKYDSLIRKLGKDAKEVYDFETKELGMHRGEKAKKNVGSLVGVIAVSSFILASILATNITGNAVSITNLDGGFNSGIIFLLIGTVCGVAWIFLKE